MASEKQIVVFGACEEEITCRIDQIPLLGETTTEYGGWESAMSGFGLLAAAQLSLCGATAQLCSAVGDDAAGAEIRRLAEKRGFDSPWFYTDPAGKTALRLHLAESGGEERSFFFPGAYGAFRRQYAEEAFASRPSAVCASTSLPVGLLDYIAETADEQGAALFLSGDRMRNATVLSQIGRCEALILTEEEVGRAARIPPDTMDACLAAAMKLAALLKARWYVIRLRERGVFLYDGTYQSLVAPPEERALDLAGTAASFFGAFVYAYGATGEAETACRFAGVAALLSAKRAGSAAALPHPREIANYCRKHDIT